MNHLNTVCIVQARMGSSRLPGKVLCDLAGRTMLDQVIDRLRRAQSLDRIVVATSNLPQDQRIVDHCAHEDYNCYAGSHDDVLDRFARAADRFAADFIVRITADCPLVDPQIVDQIVATIQADPTLDCASNVYPQRSYPRGLDVEVITRATLERLDQMADEPQHREHVTLAIYQHPEQFRIGTLVSDRDWSALRWTVDEPDDLRLVQAMYASLGSRAFSWHDCLDADRRHPQWREMNAHVAQKVA